MKDKYFHFCANNLSLLALDDGLCVGGEKPLCEYLDEQIPDCMFIYEI